MDAFKNKAIVEDLPTVQPYWCTRQEPNDPGPLWSKFLVLAISAIVLVGVGFLILRLASDVTAALQKALRPI